MDGRKRMRGALDAENYNLQLLAIRKRRYSYSRHATTYLLENSTEQTTKINSLLLYYCESQSASPICLHIPLLYTPLLLAAIVSRFS